MKLSSHPLNIKEKYDVIVVGSGYGASVAAARFSEMGKSVCVLEKGKEYSQGEFPSNVKSVMENIQLNTLPDEFNNRTGLFDYKVFDGLHVLTGSGLGGGSLINAGVIEKPKTEVLENQVWPEEFRKDIHHRLELGYETATKILGAKEYPFGKNGFPDLPKNAFIKESAEKLGKKFQNLKLSINFEESGKNQQGVFQNPCIGCGNCTTGCNFEAKNSLDKNYLAIAVANGAEIFAQIYVSHFAIGSDGRYTIYYQVLDKGTEKPKEETLEIVTSEYLVLGAGSIGSTEILLRTKEISGLKFSEKLGHHFSGNGGMISVGLNLTSTVNQVGFERGISPDRRSELERRADSRNKKKDRRKQPLVKLGTKYFVKYGKKVGPTITAMIDNRNLENDLGHVIEDAAFPGIFSSFYPFYWLAGTIQNERISPTQIDLIKSIFENITNGIRNPILHNASLLLGVGYDGSKGKIELLESEDKLNSRGFVYWPEYANQKNIIELLGEMKELIESNGGDFVDYRGVGTGQPISVHPMGGAVMADTIDSGVVNHALQVYNGLGKNDVYAGLYVMDGSVIPCSLGINPILTITAIAERAMLIAKESIQVNENGLSQKINSRDSFLSYKEKLEDLHSIGLRFEEKFFGFWHNETSYKKAYEMGKYSGISYAFNMELSVHIKNTEKFISDEPIGKLTGSVDCPKLDLSGKMKVVSGSFQQFIEPKLNSKTKYFKYELEFTSSTGKDFRLEGYKELSKGDFLNLWKELTYLNFKVYAKEENELKLIGTGISKVGFSDFFFINLGTMRTINDKDLLSSGWTRAQFTNFFLGKVFEVYTPKIGIRKFDELIPQVTSIQKHSDAGILNAKIESYPLETKDKLLLNLRKISRNDSSKNSVMLVHGLTSSSDMFTMPEHNNITNYLLDLGYTVWLYDFRMSGRLPYNLTKHEYTFDHVASYDMPLATSFIRNEIGKNAKLNVICHCLGSVSFMMSLFAGLQPEVDSVISNSVSLFCRVPILAKLKLEYLIQTGLLENVLRLNLVEPDALGKKDWLQNIVSYGNSLFHHDCDNAVCHMLSFMWGSGSSALFNHENILDITHDRLADLFGGTTLNFYKHVLKIANHGNPIRFNERDTEFNHLPNNYIESFEKNKTPIFFVTGKDNRVFTDSNLYAYRKLNYVNPSLYKFHSFPNYGHQDIFMGKNVHEDVFPVFKNFLESIS
ncbi:MAG: alpha/beta fold hydrolase [Leptospiraceae bacterium]|nr:alpha/beta fold hydrolase [Leptospiraceae bacterium]